MSPNQASHQFLVVGGGVSGCVVAGRLAEAGATALLIEAGPDSASHGADADGATGLVRPECHPGRYWPPVPQSRDPGAGSEPEPVHDYWTGFGLGGGSSINGMLLEPGDDADYNRWANSGGCPGWEAKAMAPWLGKALSALRPEIRASDPDTAQLVGAFDGAFAEIGLQQAGTTLDSDRAGLLTPALATADGLRRSVADAYLNRDDPNLSVMTGTRVASLLVEDGSAKGVELADGETVRAPTVVLAAGTIGTACLLHDTGMVRGVGDWIRNHAAVALPFRWPPDELGDRSPQVHRIARWSSGRSAAGPDLAAILMGPFTERSGAVGLVMAMTSTVRSSGRLDLDGGSPRIISNRLWDADDLARLRQATKQTLPACRRLAELGGFNSRTGSAQGLIEDLDRLRDDDLDDWITGHRGPVYHAVGSCRMGVSGTDGVVAVADPGRAGTVPGLDGVVVADASLFPDLVAGGIQLPVMAVAERVTAETLLGSSPVR